MISRVPETAYPRLIRTFASVLCVLVFTAGPAFSQTTRAHWTLVPTVGYTDLATRPQDSPIAFGIDDSGVVLGGVLSRRFDAWSVELAYSYSPRRIGSRFVDAEPAGDDGSRLQIFGDARLDTHVLRLSMLRRVIDGSNGREVHLSFGGGVSRLDPGTNEIRTFSFPSANGLQANLSDLPTEFGTKTSFLASLGVVFRVPLGSGVVLRGDFRDNLQFCTGDRDDYLCPEDDVLQHMEVVGGIEIPL